MRLAYILFGVIFLIIGYAIALTMAPDWWFASTGALVLLLLLGAVGVFYMDKDKLIVDKNERRTWKSVISREAVLATKEDAEKVVNSVLRDIHLNDATLIRIEEFLRKMGRKDWVNLAETKLRDKLVFTDIEQIRPPKKNNKAD